MTLDSYDFQHEITEDVSDTQRVDDTVSSKTSPVEKAAQQTTDHIDASQHSPDANDQLSMSTTKAKGKGRAVESISASDSDQLSSNISQPLQCDSAADKDVSGFASDSATRPKDVGTLNHHKIKLENISYVLKVITFNGESKAIVCQTTNGACPTISIANFLSLTSAIELPRHAKSIQAVRLTEFLAEYLITHEKDLSILGALEGLHYGLFVDPRFTGVNHFLEGQNIMNIFECQMLHGWLPAEDDDAYPYLVATPKSSWQAEGPPNDLTTFESAQVYAMTHPEEEISIAINSFFLNYPTNMTPHGLVKIQKHLENGALSVLFYNSHFSLLYKHPDSGEMFTLVTDSGYLASGNDVVWESLEVDHATQFYSSDFIPRSVLGESMQQDEYGIIQHFRDVPDADAMLARKLHQEEAQHHENSDVALATRLQKEADDEQRAAAQKTRRLQLQEDQRRIDLYNGAANSTSKQAPPIQDLQTHSGLNRKNGKYPKADKKSCIVM